MASPAPIVAGRDGGEGLKGCCSLARSKRTAAPNFGGGRPDVFPTGPPMYKIRTAAAAMGDMEPLSSKWNEETCSSFAGSVERRSFYFVGAKRGYPQTPV